MPATVQGLDESDEALAAKLLDRTRNGRTISRTTIRLYVVVRLKVCGQEHHRKYITNALNAGPKCPVCRTMVLKLRGHSPCGKMAVGTSRINCSGFKPCATIIVISYIMPSGIQKMYQENPGQPYHGTILVGLRTCPITRMEEC